MSDPLYVEASSPSIYLETTVPSYYIARRSKDLLVLAHQEITRNWWENSLARFRPFVSRLVIDELAQGDPGAALRRLSAIEGINVLEPNDQVYSLASEYQRRLSIPQSATADCVHLAFASYYRIDYLVTWNCKHIAHGLVMRQFMEYNLEHGIASPVICTPEELEYESG
jgi:predicted nucleic acid-binding protein